MKHTRRFVPHDHFLCSGFSSACLSGIDQTLERHEQTVT